MTESSDKTITPADFGDVFDSWISGATLSQKSIDIYGNPSLFAEYESLDRQLAIAKAQGADEEASMADSRVADIEERMVALYEQWMASKSTWTVRAVPSEVSKKMSRQYPDQKMPELPADADAPTRAKHDDAVAAYDANVNARNYGILEQTVMKIEFADGRTLVPELDADDVFILTPAITAAQLAKMRQRLGEVQYIKLIGASKLASTKEPVIPAPFSRSSSKVDRT